MTTPQPQAFTTGQSNTETETNLDNFDPEKFRTTIVHNQGSTWESNNMVLEIKDLQSNRQPAPLNRKQRRLQERKNKKKIGK